MCLRPCTGRWWLGPLLALGIIVTACGSENEVSTPLGSLFDRTPEDAEGYVYLVDWHRLSDQLDIAVPAPDAPSSEVAQWIDAMAGARGHRATSFGPVLGDWMLTAESIDDFRAQLGFSPHEAAAMAYWGNPPSSVRLLRGTFDHGRISDAVRLDPVWGGQHRVQELDEGTLYSWVGGGADAARASGPRPLGLGGALLVGNSELAWSNDVDAVRKLVDPADGSSAIDDDRRSMLMTGVLALDEVGAFALTIPPHSVHGIDPAAASVVLRCGAGCSDDERTHMEQQFRELTAQWPGHSGFLLGASLYEGRDHGVVVFLHESEELAAITSNSFPKVLEVAVDSGGVPWRDRLEVADATVDGSLAVVTLRSLDEITPYGHLLSATVRADPILHRPQP